jgi:hypothetical protein
MTFPSISGYLWHYLFPAFFGPALVVAAIAILVVALRRRTALRWSPFSAGMLIVGIAITLGVYSRVASGLRFRGAVASDEVVRIEITRLSDEESSGEGPALTIRDPARISDARTALNAAAWYEREHELFTDGYLIRFCRRGGSADTDGFVKAFRNSSRIGATCIIIPQVGESAWFNGGEYSCEPLLEWLNAQMAMGSEGSLRQED